MTEEYPVLELNERFDKLSIDNVECPVCNTGKKYKAHVPYVNVPCNVCGSKFTTDFKQDMYTKIARRLLSLISWNNGVHIRATETYEKDIIHIQEHFNRMNNWDVESIRQVNDSHVRCESCGVCFECFTCKECGTAFKKDEHKRKQTCPTCKKSKYARTYFKEVISPEENKNIKICPHCKADKIIMTRSRLKSKCHLCDSKKISEPISERIFTLTIKRKKAYRL